jgi:exopolyphosphatase/guanosine-5'-triphosphate,3'-diphosphate pyrophosphatase
MSPTSLRASIDLGTNTCLLLLAECDSNTGKVYRVVSDHSTVVRLGQGVDRARALQPEAMARTLDCLKRYSDIVRAQGVDPSQVVAVATSQARDAANGQVFFEQVRGQAGFHFRILSGDQEAQASFRGGLLPGMSAERSALIDIGGGSTEIISVTGGQSVDMGSVRFTERFLKHDPVTDEEFWACEQAIDDELQKFRAWGATLPSDMQWVAVAGTATTLAAWHLGLKAFDATRLDGLELTRGDLHRMVEELKWRTSAERRMLPGVEPMRADVLLAGAMILWRTMEILSLPRIYISTRGLRFGVLEVLKQS